MDAATSVRLMVLWAVLLVVGLIGIASPVLVGLGATSTAMGDDSDAAAPLGLMLFVFVGIICLLVTVLLGATSWVWPAAIAGASTAGLLCLIVARNSDSVGEDAFGTGGHLLAWFFLISIVVGIKHAIVARTPVEVDYSQYLPQ